jgi:hypothetical protein
MELIAITSFKLGTREKAALLSYKIMRLERSIMKFDHVLCDGLLVSLLIDNIPGLKGKRQNFVTFHDINILELREVSVDCHST